MSESTFDAFSRRAGEAVSRRTSLLTLGGAALAAMAARPGNSLAGKKNRKRNAKAKKKAKQQSFKLCKPQVGECQSFMDAACEGAVCGTIVAVCCPLLGSCQNEAFWTCLDDAVNGIS